MKLITKTVTTAAGVLLCCAGAKAQFQYNNRDLMLILRTGAASGTDLEVNIGQVGNYIQQGIANPGTPVAITNFNATQFSAATTGSTNFSWAVIGGDPIDGDATFTDRTLWLTRPRADVNTQTSPWLRKTASNQGAVLGRIIGTANNAVAWSTGSPIDAVTNSTQVAIIPNSISSSYSILNGVSGDLGTTFGQGGIENSFANGFSGYVRSDFYQMVPGSSGSGIYLGYFDFNSDGTVAFTAASPITAPVIVTQPVDKHVAQGTPATFSVVASGSPASYQWAFNGSAISGATDSAYTVSNAQPASVGAYSVTLSNIAAVVTSSNGNLTIIADNNAPTVTVTAPRGNSTATNATSITVTGTAKDNVKICQVLISLNGGAFQPANGTTNWNLTLSIGPGTNTLQVKSVDQARNQSAVTTVKFFNSIRSALSVTINGFGTILNNLDGQSLEVGRAYTMTEIPGVGQVFTNWTGGVCSSTNKLTFLMQSNMTIAANFIPNPFIPVAGSYNGLFYETNGVNHHTAGFFNAKVGADFSISGKLLLDGDSVSISGKFNLNGTFAKSIARTHGKSNVVVNLALDFANGSDQLKGTVASDSWTANLTSDRAVFSNTNLTSFAGTSTMVVPGFADVNAGPAGYSYGTIAVSTNGTLVFAGAMADGAKVSQSVPVSKNGNWPFYANLYSGKGSVLGWMTFTNGAPVGNVSWISTGTTNAYYPAGFTNSACAISSSYIAPVTNRIINVTFADLIFQEGNTDSEVDEPILLSNSHNTVYTANATTRLSFSTKTGSFVGTFFNPGTGKITPFNGVVLQNMNTVAGYFLGTNQSGAVSLTNE